MERSLEFAIHERLTAYLADETTIDDFKPWIVAATWNLDQRQSPPGIRFANEIKLLLAEHSGGFRSDEEPRDELVELLSRTGAKTAS